MTSIHPRLLRGTGAGIGRTGISLPDRLYRWNGPEAKALSAQPPEEGPARRKTEPGVSPQARIERAKQRRAEFARLRREGTGVAEAGAAVGITAPTARLYERARLEAEGGEG
jgi:hypothetical protein